MTTTPAQRAIVELVRQCRGVLGFAQSWEPLSTGDLKDLARAVDAVEAALAAPAPAGDGREAFELLAADVCVLLQLEPAEAVRRIASLVSDEALAWRREQPAAAPGDGPADLVALHAAAVKAQAAVEADDSPADIFRDPDAMALLEANIKARDALYAWTPAAPSAPTAMPPTMPSVEVGDVAIYNGRRCEVSHPAAWLDADESLTALERNGVEIWRREQP